MREVFGALPLAGLMGLGCEQKPRETAPSGGASGAITAPVAPVVVPAASVSVTSVAAPAPSSSQQVPASSKPPPLAEWDQASAIDSPGARKANCEIKQFKGWARVSCHNTTAGGKVDDIMWPNPTNHPAESYIQVRRGDVVSIVFSLRNKIDDHLIVMTDNGEIVGFNVLVKWTPGQAQPTFIFDAVP